jgi:hypothetical protein
MRVCEREREREKERKRRSNLKDKILRVFIKNKQNFILAVRQGIGTKM